MTEPKRSTCSLSCASQRNEGALPIAGPDESQLELRAAEFDRCDMATVIERLPTQIEIALRQDLPAIPAGPFNNILVAGMGGSALAVDVILDAFRDRLKVPVRVWRHYELPPWLVQGSLVIASSFSGGTEETITALSGSRKHAKNAVVLCGGGRLAALADEQGDPVIRIPVELEPNGFQPRSAIGYMVTFLARILSLAGALDETRTELEEIPVFLREVDTRKDAQRVATWLSERIPAVYTDETHLMSIARIAKIKFNENSKRPALFNALPEANHNEMIGFTRALGNFGILYLHDPQSHPRIRRRFRVMKDLFDRQQMTHVAFNEWVIPGTTTLQKIFAAVTFADWCSYTLAILDGYDPTPVALVEQFKQDLERHFDE